MEDTRRYRRTVKVDIRDFIEAVLNNINEKTTHGSTKIAGLRIDAYTVPMSTPDYVTSTMISILEKKESNHKRVAILQEGTYNQYMRSEFLLKGGKVNVHYPGAIEIARANGKEASREPYPEIVARGWIVGKEGRVEIKVNTGQNTILIQFSHGETDPEGITAVHTMRINARMDEDACERIWKEIMLRRASS